MALRTQQIVAEESGAASTIDPLGGSYFVEWMTDEIERARNRKKSKVRARVEHVFAVIKRQWGFSKVRYRGLHKNATRAFTMLALANIYMSRGLLLAKVRP